MAPPNNQQQLAEAEERGRVAATLEQVKAYMDRADGREAAQDVRLLRLEVRVYSVATIIPAAIALWMKLT